MEVKWLRSALRDLANQIDYIAEANCASGDAVILEGGDFGFGIADFSQHLVIMLA